MTPTLQPGPVDAAGGPPGPALATLARSILALLQADPARYVSFGPYWPLIKRLLKRFYSRDNLALLGDAGVTEVAAHMPPHGSIEEALAAAIAFYNDHQAYGLSQATFTDDDGETWVLADPDAAGL